MRRIDHIDLRVPDLEAVREYYVRLLPALGFNQPVDVEGWLQFCAEGIDATAFFGVTEDAAHVPNGNRTAFWAGSVEEVDVLGEVLHRIGAQNIEGPMLYEEPGYYAVFFEDPAGNKFEVCHRTQNTTL